MSPHKNKKTNENKMTKNTKYQLVEKNEHEILMDELFPNNNRQNSFDNSKSVFDYRSISEYKSIFQYRSSNAMQRSNSAINFETKPLEGVELALNYAIIGFFYFIMILFLPFSLLFCLKKVGPHERMVVYRLGRIKSPVYQPGYCIVLPVIDNFERLTIVQKEFTIPNLQILNHENAIIDTTLQIRYQIFDVVKVTNTLQDSNSSIKSIVRGVMVTCLSKIDASKIEKEKNFLVQEFKDSINEIVQKWGVKVIELDMIINSITRDENADSGEDPSLKSLKTVFKSLFSSSSSSSDTITVNPPTSSSTAASMNPLQQLLPPELMSMFQGITPVVLPANNLENLTQDQHVLFSNLNNSPINQSNQANQSDSAFSPQKLLQLLTPHLNENLVKEIQTAYEFHIRIKKKDMSEETRVFFLDLKNVPKGQAGMGSSLFSKADCIIKLSEEDLLDLLTDNLKPFTAYMNGRIEIDGDLQDVFKLKKLIKSVTAVLPKTKS